MRVALILVFLASVFTNARAGLNYTYYEGNWSMLPDFNSLSPLKSGTSANVDLSVRNRQGQFAIQWKGTIIIPANGNYTFETNSDDGSRLFIGNSGTAVVDNDGIHANRLRSGTTYLNAGAYPITITYFQNSWGQTMEVYWSSNSGISRQRIPDNVLTTQTSGGQGGLSYNYYEGNWNNIPEFSIFPVVKTGNSSNVDLGVRNRDSQYGIMWQGNITIPANGIYTFETNSDDGSKLFVGSGTSPVVNNDGLHPAQVRSGSISLTAGTYPIKIMFLQNGGGQLMEVYWSSNAGIPRQRIPDNVFSGGNGSTPVDDKPADETPAIPPPVEPTPGDQGSGGLTGNRNFYFSSSAGDDSRSSAQAQNPATPWRTLSKLNSFFSSLNAGDAVLFKRGESFDGSINVSKSGVLGAPIIFSSYGNGTIPVINGFVNLTNWVNIGNGVWESNCPSANAVNMVTLNGEVQGMGRYPNITEPNKGYLTIDSWAGNYQITDYALPGNPNWTGAEVVIRKQNWVLDRGPITSHSGNTINYTNTSYHGAKVHNGYFITNDPRTLDQLGEWYFDRNQRKLKMFFGGNNPNSYSVKASVTDGFVYLDRKSNLTFDNISFQGADEEAIAIEHSNNIRIQNCNISYSGKNGVRVNSTDYVTVENNTILNMNNDAISFGDCSHNLVKNNRIRNIGTIPGMGSNHDGGYTAIYVRGSHNTVEGNSVENVGYIGINFHGEETHVRNNYINTYCFVKDDGGGVYTSGDLELYNRTITGNTILNGIGAKEGTEYLINTGASGILFDDRSAHAEVIGNTIANACRGGIFVHNSKDITIRGNTLFNNRIQLSFVHDGIAHELPTRNMNVSENVLFSKASWQLAMETQSVIDDIGQFGRFDNNYYARPVDQNGLLLANFTDPWGDNKFFHYNIDGWKARYGFDYNSRPSPVLIPQFIVNSLVGGNKFNNGSFNSNVGSLYCAGNCSTTWNSGGKLDGGALQVGATASGINTIATRLYIDGVQAAKTYRVKFTSLGTFANRTLKVFMLQNSGAYIQLSEIKYFALNNYRTENEFLFTSPITEPNVLLIFDAIEQDCPYFLDNVQVNEVNVTKVDLDDAIRFEYNPTGNAKTVQLDATYIDVKNNTYSNSVTLNPYSSVVLMKRSSTAPNYSVSKVDKKEFTDTQIETVSFSMSPNPATDKIQINIKSLSAGQKANLSIVGASGVTQKIIPLNSSSQTIGVDISSWSKGVYFINYVVDGHVTTKKFVKM